MSKELQRAAERPVSALKKALVDPKITAWLREVTPRTFANYLTPERVVKIVIAAVSRNPILLQCSQQSLIKSIAELVSLGIEPGGPLQQGYLVPRKNKAKGANGKDLYEDGKPVYIWECMPIVSYRGYITLLRRSGQFKSVLANVVHTNDTFEIDLASGNRPKHIPCMNGDRGELVAVYSIAEFADGGTHMDLMTRSDVERIKKFSPSADSDYGPWKKHFDEMARKTVIRRASKYWPMSSEEMQLAEALESREHDDDVSFDILDVPEGLADDDEPQALPAKSESATDALLGELQEQEVAAKKSGRQPATGIA
jgi:recombination protein RecT